MTRARQNADNVAGDISGVTAGTGLSGGGTSGTVTLSADTAVVATTSNSITLSNKTIALGSNTVSGTTAEFNTALTDGEFATQAGSETLTNKTIAATSNTLTGVINNTLLSTTGDLVYASGANTPARLGIGSSGQYLSVSGGIPSWTTLSAGGMTLLASSLNTSGTTTVNFNSIDQSYVNLLIFISGLQSSSSSSLTMRLNNNSTNTNYLKTDIYWNTTSASFGQSAAIPSLTLGGNFSTNQGRDSNSFLIEIPRYSATSTQSTFFSIRSFYTGFGQMTLGQFGVNAASSASNTAISSVNFVISNNLTAGNFFLYGVK